MRKGDAKRQAILDVAEKLFYAKGFEATSVQDILDVLVTSKGSFYHHFESKENVLATLCTQRATRTVSAAEGVLPTLERPLDRLNTLFSYIIPLRKGEEKFLTLLLPLLDRPEGLSLRVCFQDALREGFLPLMRDTLSQCREAGDIYSLDNPFLPGMVIDLLNQCWVEVARELLSAVKEGRDMEPGELVDVLEMYRFALERLLDMPYGVVEILRVQELLDLLRPVLSQLKLPMIL